MQRVQDLSDFVLLFVEVFAYIGCNPGYQDHHLKIFVIVMKKIFKIKKRLFERAILVLQKSLKDSLAYFAKLESCISAKVALNVWEVRLAAT